MIDLEKLQEVMHQVATKRGPFTLFGLFLREEAPDKWDLVVSAPWLEEGKMKALADFVKQLSATIGEEQVLSLSRVVTVNHDDPALEAVLRAVQLEDGLVEVSGSVFFNLPIKHAYIMRAKRIAESTESAT